MDALKDLLANSKFKDYYEAAQADRVAFLGHWMPHITIPQEAEEYVRSLREEEIASLWFGATILRQGSSYWGIAFTRQKNPIWQDSWEGDTYTVKGGATKKSVYKWTFAKQDEFEQLWNDYQQMRGIEQASGSKKTYFDDWFGKNHAVSPEQVDQLFK